MLRNDILELIEKLKLRGMQSVYDEVLSNGRKSKSTPEKIILELLKAEASERYIRSIRYRIGQARFPALKISTVLILQGLLLMKTGSVGHCYNAPSHQER